MCAPKKELVSGWTPVVAPQDILDNNVNIQFVLENRQMILYRAHNLEDVYPQTSVNATHRVEPNVNSIKSIGTLPSLEIGQIVKTGCI
jgi:hypothetical protein